MKNTPSTSSHDSITLSQLHELIEHVDVETHVENHEEDNNIVTWKSKRRRTTKSFGEDYIIYLVNDTPKIIEEAYSSLDANLWKEAVQSEMDSITSNGTWEVVDRPYGCKPMGYKWVFKKKLRSDGTIEMYKTMLVAKGFTQKRRQRLFRYLFTSYSSNDYTSVTFLGYLTWSSRSSDGR